MGQVYQLYGKAAPPLHRQWVERRIAAGVHPLAVGRDLWGDLKKALMGGTPGDEQRAGILTSRLVYLCERYPDANTATDRYQGFDGAVAI